MKLYKTAETAGETKDRRMMRVLQEVTKFSAAEDFRKAGEVPELIGVRERKSK
ncbi:MAG: hypothetical protein WA913_08005 [Pricia sp.]